MTTKSLIKKIAEANCWHCGKPRGEHSKKNMMRCHYATEVNLYKAILKLQEYDEDSNTTEDKKEDMTTEEERKKREKKMDKNMSGHKIGRAHV